MKIRALHKGALNINSGGPAMSVYLTIKGLRKLNVDAQVIMYEIKGDDQLIANDIPIHFSPSPVETKFCFSLKYKKTLKNAGDFDIYHAHGVWQWPTYAITSYAKKNNKPYIITPRGMLYPQDMRKSTIIKNTSLKLGMNNILQNANCIHVTCNDEMNYYRALGFSNPVAIIPNPIEIKEFCETKNDTTFRLGYLGRLHPRKNVEGLIYAYADLEKKASNTELVIIGGGSKEYEYFLKSEVKRLQLRNVHFTGFLAGTEKDKKLASLSVLAMPSEFENLGNVILEGLVRKIPCIATKGSPWQELHTHKCGWWIDYNQQALTNALNEAYATSNTQLMDMGNNGFELIKQSYSIESIATKMKALYEWILFNKTKPNFVYE